MNKKIITYVGLGVFVFLAIFIYAKHFIDSLLIQSWAVIGGFLLTYLAVITPIIAILWLTIQKTDSGWQRTAGCMIVAVLIIGGMVSYTWRGNALVNECVSKGGILSKANKPTSFTFNCIETGTNKRLPLN